MNPMLFLLTILIVVRFPTWPSNPRTTPRLKRKTASWALISFPCQMGEKCRCGSGEPLSEGGMALKAQHEGLNRQERGGESCATGNTNQIHGSSKPAQTRKQIHTKSLSASQYPRNLTNRDRSSQVMVREHATQVLRMFFKMEFHMFTQALRLPCCRGASSLRSPQQRSSQTSTAARCPHQGEASSSSARCAPVRGSTPWSRPSSLAALRASHQAAAISSPPARQAATQCIALSP